MGFYTLSELPSTEPSPGTVRRSVYLDHAMITFFEMAPGSTIPLHEHPHEQITYVVSGAMEFRLGDEIKVLQAGDGVCSPPGVPHSGTVLDEPTFAIDAWYPQREEYK
jgi:quercetin dioxygenase-like cupin family protein